MPELALTGTATCPTCWTVLIWISNDHRKRKGFVAFWCACCRRDIDPNDAALVDYAALQREATQ